MRTPIILISVPQSIYDAPDKVAQVIKQRLEKEKGSTKKEPTLPQSAQDLFNSFANAIKPTPTRIFDTVTTTQKVTQAVREAVSKGYKDIESITKYVEETLKSSCGEAALDSFMTTCKKQAEKVKDAYSDFACPSHAQTSKKDAEKFNTFTQVSSPVPITDSTPPSNPLDEYEAFFKEEEVIPPFKNDVAKFNEFIKGWDKKTEVTDPDTLQLHSGNGTTVAHFCAHAGQVFDINYILELKNHAGHTVKFLQDHAAKR